MKTRRFLAKWLIALGLFGSGMSAHADQILVSSTDFSIPEKEKDFYSSIDELMNAATFGGVITPTIKVGDGYALPDSTGSGTGKEEGMYSEEAYSAFLQGQHYALVNNPIKLDSNRMYDSKESYWSAVFSLGDKQYSGNPGQELMSYTVSGLNSTGTYALEIEYCNPLGEDYLNPNSDINKDSKAKDGPNISGGYNAAIKVGANATGGTFVGNPGTAEGSCKTFKFSFLQANSDMGKIADGNLTIHIYANQYSAWEAISIKSIKVYAEVDPKIKGKNSVCTGGESSILSLSATFNNCKMQWYKNGVAIPGATGDTYNHESGNTEGETTYQVKFTTADGDKFETKEFVVKDVACCVDDNGNPASRKLIWQDDFGTFTSKNSYWVWDYTDINEPKKVTKKTTHGWQYELDYDIPGAVFQEVTNSINIDDGQYTVAGNVTCQWDDLSGGDGTQWGWPAQCFNGLNPGKNGFTFVPDHTYQGAEWGGMLFLNCGNKPGDVIYSHEIKGLCDKHLNVRCYINNFSNSDAPVKIFIRATDINTGNTVESPTVTRYAKESSGIGWEEVSVDIDLKGNNPGLKFEIISLSGCSTGGKCEDNLNGNDLILDDIQIYACAPPSVQLYFDLPSHAEDTTSCKGDDVDLFVEVTKMIQNTYKSDARYLFQWNKGPEQDTKEWKQAWKNIGTVTNEPSVEDMSKIFQDPSIQPGDEILFRVVLGYEETLNSTTYFNPDEACSSYTISEPITAIKVCPTCTEPKDDIKITSKDGKEIEKTKGKKTYSLCKGESLTLSQVADITPDKADWASDDFVGFAIKWYNDKIGKPSLSDAVLNDVVADKVVSYDAAKAGKKDMFILYAVDANYLDELCNTADTVYVQYEEDPTATLTDPDPFCEGLGAGKVISSISGYTIHWFEDADTLKSLAEDIPGSFFEGKDGSDTPYEYYYYLESKTSHCKGEVNKFVVDIREIPEAPNDTVINMVVTGKKEQLEEWEIPSGVSQLFYESLTATSGTESYPVIDKTNEGTVTLYRTFKSEGGCESEKAKIEIIISAAPDPNVKPWDVCEGGDVDFATIESLVENLEGYDLVWYADKDADKEDFLTDPTSLGITSATPGEYKFYVANIGVEAPNPISNKSEITITCYGVKKPVVAPLKYCAGDDAEKLTFEAVVDVNNFYNADGFVWSSEGVDLTPGNAPSIDTNVSSDGKTTVSYQVRQTLKLKYSKDVCEGDTAQLNIDITKVLPPTGDLAVSYVKSEGEAAGKFTENLVQKNPDVVKDKPGHTLLWSASKDGPFKATVPTPTYNASNNDPVVTEYYYAVWQDNESGCMSTPSKVTVTITSTPSPKPATLSYCEGEIPTAAEIEGSTEVNTKDIPNPDDFKLYWYEEAHKADAENAYKDNSLLPPLAAAGKLGNAPVTYEFPANSTETVHAVKYYVVQSDRTTTSPATEITLNFYAKPRLKITNPAPVCEKTIDLTSKECWIVENGVKLNVTAYASTDGTMSSNVAKNIDKSGKYSVTGEFDVPNATQTGKCLSNTIDLEVDIQKLKVEFDAPETTCPNTDIKIDVTPIYEFNPNATDYTTGGAVDHTINIVGKDHVSDSKTNATNNAATTITSDVFNGKAGDEFDWSITVTAGECTKQISGTVEIGDGPVLGNISLKELGNTELNAGVTRTFKASNDVITCGRDLEIDLSEVTNTNAEKSDDFAWYDNPDYTGTPKKGATYTYTSDQPGKLYVQYTNKCKAYAVINVKPVPVKILTDELGEVSQCEGTSFLREVEVQCPETPNITWYKNDVKIDNLTSKLDFKSLDKDAHEGLYKFLAVKYGCRDSIEVVDLEVRKYVRFEVTDFDSKYTKTHNNDTTYVVTAREDLTIPMKYSYPTDYSDVEVEWKDNTNKGSGDNSSYKINGVDENHKIHITAGGDAYCSTELNVTVLRDAKLILDADLEEKMCLNDEKKLYVDTIGTGAFVYPDSMSLIIKALDEVTNEETIVKNPSLLPTGRLEKIVSPRHSTTYTVTFSYRGQTLTKSKLITVFNFEVVTKPGKVCAGDEILLMATRVEPAAAQLRWYDSDENNQPDKANVLGETSVVVTPQFEGTDKETSSRHRYFVLAYNSEVECESFFPLDVTVYRPLEGQLNDTVVCIGQSIRLDAGNFNASKYVWKSSANADSTLGRYKSDIPQETTQYTVYMTRGVCEKSASATAKVMSLPRIASVDSVDYWDRLIVMDESTGQSPYYFSVDGSEFSTNELLTGLLPNIHTVVIRDKNGCESKDTFYVAAQELVFPPHHTPNGDGESDFWSPVGIQKIYPNAEVTIFDRWGKVVAKYKGEDDGWDGTYNGNDLPSTDYWYEVVVREIDKVYTGHFTLIRR